MKHILIDDQKTIEVTPIIHDHPSEGRTVVLSFDDTYRILEEWVKFAPSRRNYCWANEADDNEPSKIVIAEAVRNSIGNPTLLLEVVEPYWDGVSDLNQYPLDVLSMGLGTALQWGAAIGEEEP